MDGKIGLETLIFLVIAVVIIWRLRSVLGRRTGDERQRYDRAKAEQAQRAEAQARQPANDKVVTLPRRDPAAEPAVVMGAERFRESMEERIRKFAGANVALAESLLAIARQDKAFDPEEFLRGGRQAYEMIVTAFADSYNQMVKALRNYKAQTVKGGLGTGGRLGVDGGSTPASRELNQGKK